MAEKLYNLQGTHHNFIKVHDGPANLASIEKLIKEQTGDFARYSVHVFHKVAPTIDAVEIGKIFNNILQTPGIKFTRQKLRKTSVPGVYINDKDAGEHDGSPNVAQMLMGDKNVVYPATLKEANEFVESTLLKVSEGTVPLYAMNFEPPRILKSHLSNVPNHISVENNRLLDRSIGINVPTFYLGGQNSFTEFHIEDCYLDSCNLQHWGTNGASKVWTFIDPTHSWKFCQLMHHTIEYLRKSGEDCSHWLPGCCTPQHHKNICVSPSFLAENDIKFETVVQPPGTEIYVGDGVYHQVMNTGLNMSEAVNVGSSKWNSSAHKFISCHCPGNAISWIEPNPDSYSTVKSHEARAYFCEEQGCDYVSSSKKFYNLHMQEHLKEGIGQTNVCTICHKFFVRETNLKRHNQEKHSPDTSWTVKKCEKCNILINHRSYASHIKTCAPGGKTCEWCGDVFSRRGIMSHKRHCKSQPQN